jgi:hypothetical protein
LGFPSQGTVVTTVPFFIGNKNRMQLIIQGESKQLKRLYLSHEQIDHLFSRIADSTDTSQLVIALYFMTGIREVRGIYLRNWNTPNTFRSSRGKWAFTQSFSLPDHLPAQFRLIRMRVDGISKFPRQDRDAYGWLFTYQRLEDHLATLFAHELHHFRRYHLNLHHREAEQGANRWALSHVSALGFQVTGENIRPRRRSPMKRRVWFATTDPYKEFRLLKTGDEVIIRKDPKYRYINQKVRLIRPIRRNSKRMVIETPDGKQWRWPINWLSLN